MNQINQRLWLGLQRRHVYTILTGNCQLKILSAKFIDQGLLEALYKAIMVGLGYCHRWYIQWSCKINTSCMLKSREVRIVNKCYSRSWTYKLCSVVVG